MQCTCSLWINVGEAQYSASQMQEVSKSFLDGASVLHLHHVASQRKSLLLFHLYGFIFLSLQVGLLFIVGFATNDIKPCAFAAICFALTHLPEIADPHSAHISS